jgi:hypothetical protein
MSTALSPGAPAQVRCPTCGRVADCTPTDLRVYAAIGAPRCCGKPMALPTPGPRPSGREAARRPVRAGVRADVRRPGAEADADLGAALADVSADGASVRLTGPALIGDELDIAPVRADGRIAARVRAEVRWCRPIGGGLFAAGVGFRRRITLTELAEVVR